jgi:hypothetical protein
MADTAHSTDPIDSSMAPGIRRVAVEPLTARTELLNVFRAGMVILVATWMYIATHSAAGDSASRRLFFYQALVQDRASTEQRMFRELQEGLLEAEVRRASTGKWPTPAALTADGVPPFAADPTAKNARYRWSLLQNGLNVNYIGIPEQADAPAWLLVILEPDPNAPPDLAREDEEHHKLSTGAMLHVSTWLRPDGRVADRMVRLPQGEGWTQLFAIGAPASQTGAR